MTNILPLISAFDIKIAILVLISYAIIDALYAKYTFEVTSYNEYRAASIWSFMHFMIAFGVISYTENWLYIIPLAIWSWIWTFIVVRKERLSKEKNSK